MSRDKLDLTLMQSRVLDSLEILRGASLSAINYWCLRGEADKSQICSQKFYFGGEVEIIHTNSDSPIRITWDENAGFSEDFSFSVRVVAGSTFLPDTLEVFDASLCAVWKPHINQKIQNVRVFGREEIPYVVVLGFSSGEVSIGSSWQTKFGDGDDVYIEPFDMTSRAMKGLSEMWASEKQDSVARIEVNRRGWKPLVEASLGRSLESIFSISVLL